MQNIYLRKVISLNTPPEDSPQPEIVVALGSLCQELNEFGQSFNIAYIGQLLGIVPRSGSGEFNNIVTALKAAIENLGKSRDPSRGNKNREKHFTQFKAKLCKVAKNCQAFLKDARKRELKKEQDPSYKGYDDTTRLKQKHARYISNLCANLQEVLTTFETLWLVYRDNPEIQDYFRDWLYLLNVPNMHPVLQHEVVAIFIPALKEIPPAELPTLLDTLHPSDLQPLQQLAQSELLDPESRQLLNLLF